MCRSLQEEFSIVLYIASSLFFNCHKHEICISDLPAGTQYVLLLLLSSTISITFSQEGHSNPTQRKDSTPPSPYT